MEHFQELLVVAARVGQEIVERERHWRDAQRVGAGLDLRDLAVVLGAVNGLVLDDVAGLEEHRSEEHTSELQSPDHLVCRLLLEKKKSNQYGSDVSYSC